MTTPAPDTTDLTLSVLDALPADAPAAPLTSALDILTNERRRHVLRVVGEQGETMTLPDVADEVAVRECGRPLPEIQPETVTETYISIYHDHLPRLVDANLLAYDQERDLVHPRFATDAVDSPTN
ncbi:hypothetical protein Halru_2465 [Halovivax ruber XH-70]|uniref:DUF7344 domain-containing protein n=1 Tax=Halovivax ruber (strain DSM 18193 / JCM 13892 / XH-70) TaxID=797302 RepID=L0IGD2_HALRX|nr:hypothetical protein [Halovivax ruber]AGB17047.1 hypothetical protein Halru_2465 [Halovivax ruber XH-70]